MRGAVMRPAIASNAAARRIRALGSRRHRERARAEGDSSVGRDWQCRLVPFLIGAIQAYIGPKGYKEFAAQNRAPGWDLWLTFLISPALAASLAAALTAPPMQSPSSAFPTRRAAWG